METNSIPNKKDDKKRERKFLKKITKKKVFAIIAIILCVVLVGHYFLGRKKKNIAMPVYAETAAVIGNITETIEQSGVVEPYERREITSRVKGEIIESPFEEGDWVEEGMMLYRIDDEDAYRSIEKAQNNLEKSQMSLDEINDDIKNLEIYAPVSGKLTDFSLEVGDNVGNGIIANIVNSDILSIDIPFSVNDFDSISVGDAVTVTSALYMTSLPGTVIHKYDTSTSTGNDGSILKNIEIEIKNPGALAADTTFAATVSTSSGDVQSAGSGIVGSGKVTAIKSEVNGTVSVVNFKNGDYVEKGQLIVKMTNNSLVNSRKSSELNLRDSELNMETSQKTLEDYNITAPISGTVITKNSKAGDNIDNSSGQTVMMVIADMSKMKFTIQVDELDISKITLEQTAIVTADALKDDRFTARVTNIASEGTSSGDGVTTYDVELTIDEPGNLKSQMNVNATILIANVENVVKIPEQALMSVRGSKASVLVKTGKKNSESNNDQKGNTQGGFPEGCESRQVEVGISDGNDIEVISGLSEGEIVVYIPATASSGNRGFMGMMRSGMAGGGMMGGGMSGSNRGGGMPSNNRR